MTGCGFSRIGGPSKCWAISKSEATGNKMIEGRLCEAVSSWKTDVQDRNVNVAPILMNSTLLIVGFFTLYPVVMLLFGSVRDAPPGEAASFTLTAYREV